jgi:PAS domain S-box-containing protein
MIGYTQEELLNRAWADCTHPDDIAFNEEVINNILSDVRQSDRWEKRYLHKDGSTIWVDIHTYLFRDTNDNPLYFVTTVNDITKRRSIEEALAESEERFRTLIRQMNEGVAIIDPSGLFMYTNPAAEFILGVGKDSLTGSDARNILGNDLIEKIQHETDQCKPGEKKIFEYEFTFTCCNEKILAASATPRLKEQKKVETFILFRDITANRKAEDEIRQQNEKLKLSNAEKDKFFAILAHDLRSPLSTFLGLAEVMAEDINSMSKSEVEEISKSLCLSASNLFQLLENLLEWSILRRGNSEYHPQPMNLNQVILRSMEPFQETARRKNITLRTELDKSFHVISDLKMTETIFRNLISNALKYTRTGGSVILAARQASPDVTEVRVTDTGIGMDKELLSKLFTVNEQVSRKGTDGEASSGLGLLICKEFIDLQGGKIWAESEENKGSTFYFTLKNAD